MAATSVFMSVSLFITFAQRCTSTPYAIDYTNGVGRRFDGVGAISGGGATSKLLVNYPEPYRSHVLDYLFKPNFGASLQILKVEIGGDSQSSEGTESSHMHHSWDENYSRGYEWWLMVEAKKRNPDIKLYGLPWGFPGWISDGAWWPYRYPNTTATYIIKWIQGARTHYNLTIDYVGIWNEKPYDPVYVKTLKRRLVESGLGHVQIVASDAINVDTWDIAKDMISDPELMKAVDIVGGHYPGTATTPEARSISKPLWASEDYSNTADDYGAACIARLLNQNFVNGQMTGFLAWNLIASYYDNLPYRRHSLMVAQQPWSGSYDVAGPVWTTAHTTQFTGIGWSYLKTGRGSGFLKKGGSYVSFVSPNKKDLTIVIETTNGMNHGICLNSPMRPYAVKAQNVTFNLKGPLGNLKQLYLWKSKMDFKKGKSLYFKQLGALKMHQGSISLTVGVDEVLTLTTIVRGLKGSHGQPPKAAPFPTTYSDNFEKYREESEADDFAQQVGVFEVHQTNTAVHGKVLRQVMLMAPNHWCPFVQTSPLTVIGDYKWTDVAVSADVRVRSVNGSSGTVLAARVDQGGCFTLVSRGVFMFLDAATQVVELALDLGRTVSVKKVNFVLDPETWYRASLEVKGNMTVGTVDGQVVFKEIIKSTQANGFTALGSINFGLAEYDNFLVKAS